MTEAKHLIGGQWEGTATKEVLDPGDGSLVGTVAWGSAEDASRACDAASAAFTEWADMPARARADILRRAADILTGRREEIALLLAREAGKRLPEALGEVDFSAEYFRWFAEEARRGHGSIISPEHPDRRHLTIQRPIGVVASLTPWNFPVSIQARKLAPILAAGCTVVARVSEKAPLAVTELIRVLVDAGVPAGVLNLVHGPSREITSALLSHPATRAVSFTGSTNVGKSIMAQASDRIVRPLLELGGNAPFVVFDDADMDATIEGAILGRLRNTGQSCVAANRFIVHKDIAEEFGARLARRFDAMTIGHSIQDGDIKDLGPMIDQDRVATVQALIDDAVAKGGRLLTTRTAVPSDGAFLAPALVADVPGDSALAQEEVFGPAAGIFTFSTDEEALALANATEMGLAAYVWTKDAARTWNFAEHLNAGIIGINDPLPSVVFAPMGGTKQSGLGREGGSNGMEEFMETSYVAWRP